VLKKAYRLKSNSAFIATYKQGNIVGDEYFTLYGGRLKEKDSPYSTRFGFVVSKKIHKRAVKRNRIKRLLRENIRLSIKNKEAESINKYISLVFVAKPSSLELDFCGTRKSVLGLLNKLAKRTV